MPQNLSLEAITQAMVSFVNAKNWDESKEIVEQNKTLLLTDEADALFADLLTEYADNPNATRRLTEHRALLQRCRTEGIEAAFADKVRPAPPAAPDISDMASELMAHLMSIESEEELTQLLTEHPELLPAMQQAEQGASDVVQELVDKLFPFIRAETWAESKAYLLEHPELLTDDADMVFGLLIEQAAQQGNADHHRIFTQHRQLLSEARQRGIEAAFAPFMTSSPSEQTNALLPLLNALLECDSPRAVIALAEEHPELLSDEVDALLQQNIAVARAQGTDEGEAYAQHVAERLNILRQLRQMMDEAEKEAETAPTGQQVTYQEVPMLFWPL